MRVNTANLHALRSDIFAFSGQRKYQDLALVGPNGKRQMANNKRQTVNSKANGKRQPATGNWIDIGGMVANLVVFTT